MMDNSTGNQNPPASDDNNNRKALLNPGDKLGLYKIIRILGRGGMGEVYEAEHSVLRRRFALKLLPRDFAKRTDALERFKREAQVMANLGHPNIIHVDEFGEDNGRFWLRMELAEGGMIDSATISSRQTQRKEIRTLEDYAVAHGGCLPPDELQVIFTEVLEGLAYAHSQGIIHRDLKPSNILVCTDDGGNATFKVSDFGLVHMVGEKWLRNKAEKSVRLSMGIGSVGTQTNASASNVGSSTRAMLGTFEYMSPEQKRGGGATAASDVYAIGLMMYRLLTGRQLGARPPSYYIKELGSKWDSLILTALEENASDRFPTAGEMIVEMKKSIISKKIETGDVNMGLQKESSDITEPPSSIPVSNDHIAENVVDEQNNCAEGDSKASFITAIQIASCAVFFVIGMIVIVLKGGTENLLGAASGLGCLIVFIYAIIFSPIDYILDGDIGKGLGSIVGFVLFGILIGIRLAIVNGGELVMRPEGFFMIGISASCGGCAGWILGALVDDLRAGKIDRVIGTSLGGVLGGVVAIMFIDNGMAIDAEIEELLRAVFWGRGTAVITALHFGFGVIAGARLGFWAGPHLSDKKKREEWMDVICRKITNDK